jgi:hypothetical protein
MFTLFSSIIFLFFYRACETTSGPLAPSSHERMDHSQSLVYVKGFKMEGVKYDREKCYPWEGPPVLPLFPGW